jgi:deazaflavin-dependent oxidoreductase (nitroreductase family)
MKQRMTIVLATTGRRSGQPRRATLYAFPDGDALVVVGSLGGAARHPAWVHNLRAQPRATVRRGRTDEAVAAREVTEPRERQRLWALVTGAFPLYAAYQRRTKRLIPLFVLEPIPQSGATDTSEEAPGAVRHPTGESPAD